MTASFNRNDVAFGGLGFQGDDILGTFDHPLADDILDLLEGLLNELYANIAKHAAPHEWYAVTISFDRRHVIISASDVLKDEAVRLGLGSGLKRYRTVIESMSGTSTSPMIPTTGTRTSPFHCL